ncbi:bifunctional 2-polyprenyl-6-hydroxyphenol methylase/3-demethylubiquinol 3-O-methyltransferase UbiG [Pseudomonas protegens]|uniref:class I SAM-dependent methyltransferase n=1 Tax=Pseudomonas protegens TaxID=380021 RepID=UPI001C829E30|nr:class I SAM-dependent methyltransferase [Pseudomonas protegens]
MKQNIYDNEIFFRRYKLLRQNGAGLKNAMEIPALRAQLPPLEGLRVLDLGCGFGDFTRLARSCGTAAVTGIDISERMIEGAQELADDPCITFHETAFEDSASSECSFDLVVSSMTLHYVADYPQVVNWVYRTLKPGARFVFSVEHPICTSTVVGWVADETGDLGHWPVDSYSDESIRANRWFVDDVRKYHRTVETYVNALLKTGFQILHLGEPVPNAEYLASKPELQEHLRRPAVLLLAVEKPLQ